MSWLPWLLVFTIPFALWVLHGFPERAAERDFKLIKLDGASDTLKKVFHAVNALQRGSIIWAFATIGAAPILQRGVWPFVLLVIAIMCYGLSWFFHAFNPSLSHMRGLHEYYVSAAPDAAYMPDRWIWSRALRAASPDASKVAVEALAASKLRRLLQQVLIGGAVLGLLCGAAAFYLAFA